MVAKRLSPNQAKAVYDKIGSLLDAQSFYEDAAVQMLIEHASFNRAHSVFEFGFGTGRFAEQIFKACLPHDCRYVGIDISQTMLELARERLDPFKERVSLECVEGISYVENLKDGFDRFVANYVFDLLSASNIRWLVHHAHRTLNEGGKLCCINLTHGHTWLSKTVSRLWDGLYATNPKFVGGCRPINMLGHLDAKAWDIEYHNIATTLGVSSEVTVATKRKMARPKKKAKKKRS